jgi:hypothetical protein
MAYVTLRLKKGIRRDFNRSDKQTLTDTIDIVIPTIGKDLPVFRLYIAHLRANLTHTIGNIYVVSSAHEEALQAYCQEQGLVFIDETTVLGYGKDHISYQVHGHNRSGWLFQQLLKLSGDTFVTSTKYIIIDSDTLIVRPLSFMESGRGVFFESNEWNEPYFIAVESLFGFRAPHPLSLTSHMMIFDVARLQEMKAAIEARHQVRWDEAYITCCDKTNPSGISDYETYAQWMIQTHPNEVYTTPFYNASLGRKAFFEKKLTGDTFANHAHSLSLHSYN